MTPDTLALLLNLTIFLPLVGIPLVLALPARSAKTIALAVSLVPFALSILLYQQYLALAPVDTQQGGFLFTSMYYWFGSAGADGTWATDLDIKYMMGVDGISIYLVLLTTLLFPISFIFSGGSISKYEKGYYALLLLLETGVLGVFCSLDLLLFYVFFEIGLIPMYFLIGLWGGKDRIYATVKFVLYTLVGSLIMLIGILYLGGLAGDAINGGVFTTDFLKLRTFSIPVEVQLYLFLAFALGFAIKVPLFPLHTWLPDAHVQAPTAGSVILAGVLLKMGTYGLIRFCLPLFPEASVSMAPVMCLLSVIGIIYGAMVAMVQTDIKKLVAYSSVAHMGFIVLGIFSFSKDAMSGAVLQMINHGISTGALFLLIGMVYDRRHTREIKDYQGIAKQVPLFTMLFLITTFSSVGLPGLNGFIGEFLVLIGAFQSPVVSSVYAIIATTGVIVAAVYMLWMVRRVFFGHLDKQENGALTDLNFREVGVMLPLIILMFVIGFHATPFLIEINRSSDQIVQQVLNVTTGLANH